MTVALPGGSSVTAMVTNAAVADLALAEGAPVVALFKASHVLVGVPVLRDLNKALLNALSELVEAYVYSPQDIIVDWNSKVAGVYIISTGKSHSISRLLRVLQRSHFTSALCFA